jgi:hypothetical protein
MKWNQIVPIVAGCTYYQFEGILCNTGTYQRICLIRYDQQVNSQLSLVPSKASAAVRPACLQHVHSGDEATFAEIIAHQPGIRMMCNGTYHHFSKTLYDKALFHEDYVRGDNVLFASYRGWNVGDMKQNTTDAPYRYAMLRQSVPGHPFRVTRLSQESEQDLYAITCSPMLIHNTLAVHIDQVLLMSEQQSSVSASSTSHVLPPGNLQHLRTQNARTMIAETVTGDLLFITIDGPPKLRPVVAQSQATAAGMNFHEQVSFLESLQNELKIKHAANLDGGGSTCMYIETGSQRGIVNQPTEPGRAIGNTLILFDHSLLDSAPHNISAAHRDQIMKAHSKHVDGFFTYSR